MSETSGTRLSVAVPLDWESWRESFDLPAHALWSTGAAFPAIAANAGQEGVPITAELLLALDAPPTAPPLEQFMRYLDDGELAAASALLPIAADEAHDTETLQQRLAARREELELEYSRTSAATKAAQDRLVALGERALEDSAFAAGIHAAMAQRESGRLGECLRLLRDYEATLLAAVGELRNHLTSDLARLREDAAGSTTPLREALDAQLGRAEEYLHGGYDELAASAVRNARAMLETRSAAPIAPPERDEYYRLRDDFPAQIRAHHLVNWVERGEQPHLTGMGSWENFARGWLPPEWVPGGKPDDQVYAAVLRLSRAHRAVPFAKDSTWQNLLKDLFDLLGRRGEQPNTVEEMLAKVVFETQHRPRVGFWLGWCAPTLALRGTFLDRQRIGERGLPVLIWHRPRQGKGPKPSSLELHLRSKTLLQRPLLVLADEPVEREDGLALRRVAQNAALLDENALLRIILSASTLSPAHDATRMRQLAFAAAVSSQFPAAQASPFTESGAAPSGMFFGRGDVLRDLRDPNGPTVLYGGRRLGKSSILHELRRLFVDEDRAHNVGLYVDCSNAGMTADSVVQLARRLTEQLRAYEPPTSGVTLPPFRHHLSEPGDVSAFLAMLERLLRAFPQHRLLLLLDEADTLCAYLNVLNTPEFTSEQRLGWGLRGLVADFPGRFDVRLAGFQEIQRTTASPDGPFFNFRTGTTSLPLKVFPPPEASDLLVSTLRGLAVEFATPALVDRLLEFTGRHPALLQEVGRRLYGQVRDRHLLPPWRISAEDVDAVMLDPGFRKSVVNMIHLNVSRPTRAQRTLALLLYLWVQQIMAPEGGERPRETRSARDLFDLVGRLLGAAAQRQLDVATIESYLGDLEVLGVIERRGAAYAFAYRAFATLLYHDYFAGGLGRQTIRDAWERLAEETSLTPRALLPTPDGHTLSPLPREGQDRLVGELARTPVLLLGPAGSGLSLVGDWAGRQPPPHHPAARPRVAQVAAGTTADELRAGLAEALGLANGADWVTFAGAAGNLADAQAAGGDFTTVLIDGIDGLAASDEVPLFFWEHEEVLGHAHVFDLVGALTRRARGRLRFLFTGGLPTARLWVDNADAFVDALGRLRTERLSAAELPAWLEAKRLIVPDGEALARIWGTTGGDWRLLHALEGWLRQTRGGEGAIETDEAEVARFAAAVRDPETRARALPGLALRLADPDLAGLRAVVRAARDNDMAAGPLTDWREACALTAETDTGLPDWPPMRWETELRALALLGEIGETVSLGARTGEASSTLTVRQDDPWLALLRP